MKGKNLIKNFIDKGLKDFFYDGEKKGINPKHAQKLESILERLDAAEDIEDMRYPGSYLHKLEPKSEERWSVKIDKNWRITFIFRDGEAWDINYVDYH
jgi:proteic killer suppression protein